MLVAAGAAAARILVSKNLSRGSVLASSPGCLRHTARWFRARRFVVSLQSAVLGLDVFHLFVLRRVLRCAQPMECGDSSPLLGVLECGDLSPLLGVLECGDLSPLLDGPVRRVPGEVRIGAGSGDETPGRPNKAAMNRRTPKTNESPQSTGVCREYCEFQNFHPRRQT
jgi:hypothetical protein